MFFCQAEDGIRCLVRSRGRGDVYKRQALEKVVAGAAVKLVIAAFSVEDILAILAVQRVQTLSLIHI